MKLEGTSIFGFSRARIKAESFHAVRAATGEVLEPPYRSVTDGEIDQALRLAASAFPAYRVFRGNLADTRFGQNSWAASGGPIMF
jgi:hypothetical protein